MIVSEKDPVGKKIKWYLICLLGNVAILVLVGGILPFLVIEYFNKIVGGILFLPCFWLAGKLCNSLENYIGIAGSLQNPNRHNLVRVFSDWSPPWMRSDETKKEKKK